MPTLEELDTLKNRINELGDEPRLLAERGEKLHDVAPPEARTDADLEQLLDDDFTGGGIDEMEALLGTYADDLDDLEPPDELNLDDLTPPETGDEESTPEEIPADESLDEFGFEDSEAALEAEQPPESEIDDLGEDFSIDDLDLGETFDDIDTETAELPESDEGDDFSLDDLSIDEFSEVEAEPSAPPDELPEEGLSEGEFSEEEFPAEEAPAEETPTDELPAGDLDDLSADDFSVGDLDDFTADEMPADEFPPEEIPAEEPPVEETEFSLDDMDFGEPDETEPPETDLDTVGELDDLEELEDLEEDSSEEELSIPDVGAAVDGLGDVDEMEDGGETELSLDDDMNFEEEIGVDILSDMREMGDESHQFSMDDFGDQYNFKEGEAGFADELGVDLEKLEQNIEDVTEEETEKFSLDEEDFRDIRLTLASLPRNLKIAIEEVLADDRWSADDIKPLIDGLIDGESPKSLAARFKTITRRRIELPRSYEKRSGQALEARRAALAYRLLREGWPVVRTILVVISVAWVLGAISFMWIYRPIHAEKLYRQGLESISVDEVEEGVDSFYDAWDGWPLFRSDEVSGDRIGDAPVVVKGWKNNARWLDYARSLRRRKHWDSATRFYEGYLTIKPEDKDIRLEYADFLSRVLGQYGRAVTVLEDAPVSGRRKYDRDYTLAAGDVYMDWAEDDPSKFEEARFRYAKVLETSRNDERAILSMMRYHLRLADQDEIETLLPIFDHEVPGKTQEPSLAAEVFAGLGEYQLRRGNLEKSRRFIDLGLAADPLAAEPSFVDAAYWRTAGNEQRELSALRRTLVNLEGIESLSRRDLEMRILTLGGMGRVQAERSYRFTEDPAAAAESRSLAMNNYSKALDLYEDAVERNQLGAAPEYGRLYMELGDILYRGSRSAGDLSFIMSETPETYQTGSERYTELLRAEEYYNRAETLYDRGDGTSRLPDETLYRRAYIRYTLNSEDSLVDFYRVARRRPEDYDVRLALATSLLAGEDYEASRSQYARTLELLDEELRRTGGVLNPLERQGHEELLLRYIIAWNNLGVGRARSAARGGSEDDYAAALSAFTMASEYHDEVYDDMGSLISRGAVGMRDIDDTRLVEASNGRNLLKEKSTYPYRNRLRLLGLETAEVGEDEYLMYADIPADIQSR